MKFKETLSLILLVIVSIAMVACSDIISDPDDNRIPDPAESAKATTTNDSTIRVKWTPSPSETDTAFVGYVIKTTGDDGSMNIDTIAANLNPLQISGLTQGTIYTFEIKTLFDNGNLSSGTSVKWSPAFRFTSNNNDAPIRLYETASLLGSGLDVYDQTTKKPKTYKLASGEFWSLGLDTRAGKVIIASPTKIDYSFPTPPGYTEISDDFFDAASLDDVYDSEALNSVTFAEYSIPLTTLTIEKNLVLIIRTKEVGSTKFNYAKVLIKKPAGASWLQGSGSDRYLEVIVSYQEKAEVPYAKKPIL
jgi:hypothetical protein